jgi:ABC-type multidrug transport system fused ATPase/permease subunit
MINQLIELMGQRAFILSLLAFPIGLAVGFVELGLGLSLQGLLVFYKIFPEDSGGYQLSDMIGLDPRVVFFLVAISVGIFRYFAFLLPLVSSESFNQHARGHILRRSVGSGFSESTLYANDITHLTSNLIPNSIAAINIIVQLCVAIFMSLVLVFGMFKISAELSALALGLSVLASILLIPAPFWLRKISKELHQQVSGFTHHLMKDVQHLYFLKIIGTDHEEYKILDVRSARIFSRFRNYYTLHGAISIFPFIIGIFFIVIIIEANIKYSLISISSLIPFVYFLHRFSSSATQISQSLGSLIKGIPFLHEYSSFIQKSPVGHFGQVTVSDVDVPDLDLLPLSVSNLTIGRTEILFANLSLHVVAGETLLITGESGRGKTTLLLTLVGLIPKIEGSVKWGGHELTETISVVLRKKISFAGPDPYLFSGTVRENLLFGIDESLLSEQAIKKALWCASADFVYKKKGGLYEQLGEDGDGLSAGQKQRISIARAVLRRPSVFLFDETTANIDESTEVVIMTRLRQEFPKAIIIAVSHRGSMKNYATTELAL